MPINLKKIEDDKLIRVLIIGDIVGSSGMRAMHLNLSQLKKQYSCDLIIANVENANDGFGITESLVSELLGLGVQVMTSGNHIWQHPDVVALFNSSDRILRPQNYPRGVPGYGVYVENIGKQKVGIINLQGRVSMQSIQCPFEIAEKEIKKLSKVTSNIIIDFHAESLEEKEALAFYLDGKVSAVVGTHTHIQTADERILPKGTAYITDLGMTGPIDSVIGMKSNVAIKKFLTQLPLKMEVAESAGKISGVLLTINCLTGNVFSIDRIMKNSIV